MELLTLDSAFQPVSYLQFINLQWNREYYQPGNFSVQIPAEQYLPEMKYLYTPDRPETGIIQKTELTETVKGRFVQLSGFFLEAVLNDKIVYPTYYASGPLDAAVTDMVNQYKGDIPFVPLPPSPSLGSAVSWQETGGQLGDAAYTRLQTQQMSYRCLYDYENGLVSFSTWKGIDRTQNQTANHFVVFSDGFRNLESLSAAFDNSNYKNYAVVAGQDKGENRKIAYADKSGGGYRKILFVDARNEQWDSEKQTEAEYLEGLRQRGFEKLLDYQDEKNIQCTPKDGTFQYLTDFDLGDLVDVAIPALSVQMQARIISVREVEKRNCHTVLLELGDKMITDLKKARLIY